MAKTVSLPPVRVEPEMLDDLSRISEETGLSVYELTRQAVADLIYRDSLSKRAAQAAHLDDDGQYEHEIGLIPS